MSTVKQQNDVIAHWALKGLSMPVGFETQSGFCLRWTRQVIQAALGEKNWPVPRGFDARQSLRHFQRLGWVLPEKADTIPGDLYFWIGPNHGKHGHVAIRIYGNRIAENSSFHVFGDDVDARGTRLLRFIEQDVLVVRFPVRP